MRWPRSRDAIAPNDMVPRLGNVLALATPHVVPNVKALARDLLGEIAARDDALDIGAALILAYAIRNPDEFLFGLSLALQYRAAALLEEYCENVDGLVAAPDARRLLRKGLRGYARLDGTRRQQIVATVTRGAANYALADMDVGDEIVKEYGGAMRRTLAVGLVIAAVVFILVSPAWWQAGVLAGAAVLWQTPIRRTRYAFTVPQTLMTMIYKRVQLKHRTFQRAQRLIADIGRDVRWARPGLGPPRLAVDACEMRWVCIAVWAEPPEKSDEKPDFVIPLNLHLDEKIEYDRDLLTRALHERLIKADQEHAMRLRLEHRPRLGSHGQKKDDDVDPWLGTPAAAKRIGMSEQALRDLADEGKIAHRKRGRVYRFRPEVLDAYLKSGGSKSPQRQ